MEGSEQRATGRGDQFDRLSVQDAAQVLGMSEEAVRGRIKRGTLTSERSGGRVWVLVERPGDDQASDRGELVAELREQVGYLRDQLRREQDAHAEARRLLAGALERIPALEAPETPESAAVWDTPTEHSDAPEMGAEGAGRRSWWRRLFEG
jgi:hypothetical protein